ncbi:AfsR/SARP family transcriptional regulator [Actinoplanes sp. NPDC051861]|uniref:AfsR/SARP family transcriptional regulator n=1 Tax=Actinoplanes sp. NPDC051861 TaxID=3155170 RepID=UPI0034389658
MGTRSCWIHERGTGMRYGYRPATGGRAPVPSAGVCLRLLGTVTVLGPRGPIRLGGARAQRLLAVLALSPGRTVSPGTLIDAAWPDAPPATCREQIKNGLGTMRRSLAASLGRTVLVRDTGGYRLDLDEDAVDAHVFSRALRRPAQPEGERAAVARLREALSLWNGPALDGIAEGVLAVEATRLDDMRLAAYEELFDREMGLGAGPALAEEIAPLARRHPTRERLTLQLMTVLHESGRAAEAIRAMEEHRRRLHAEVGVRPDPALRHLAARIWQGRAGHATEPGQAELGDLLTQLAELTDEIARRLGSGPDCGCEPEPDLSRVRPQTPRSRPAARSS